jgi:hypothetical protein
VITALLIATALAGSQADPVVVRLEHLTNCGNWKVAIRASGDAQGDLFNGCHPGGPKKVKVRKAVSEQLASLRVLVQRERFRELDERPHEDQPMIDDPACVIEVVFADVTHGVTISGSQLASTDPALESFRRIWRAVQAMVPEPAW